MSSDDEDYSTVNPKAHKKLLSEISEIVKIQHIKKPTRTEPALKNSEFHLVKAKPSYGSDGEEKEKPDSTKKVTVSSILDVVTKNTKQKKVGKQLKDVFKGDNVVAKPMEKIHVDRIERNMAYDNTKKKLGRWDAIVSKNRASEQLKFPLDQSKTKFDHGKKKSEVQQFRYKNKLMQEMEDLHNECFPKVEVPDVPEESSELLTLAELKERRKELARLKMKESNQIIKKRMQGKIKSKKYHKLKKREELKKKMKDFEELKKTNPELALKELDKIEQQRVKERTTLRHKNTGTWAKNLMVRSKYDENVKKDLEVQLALGRELTQKHNREESSDSEEETVLMPTSSANPWINGKQNADELDEAFSGYKKFWDEHNKTMEVLKDANKDEEDSSDEDSDAEEQSNNEEENSNSEVDEAESEENSSASGDDDIEGMFDEAEEDLNEKIESKLKKLRPKLLEDDEEDEKLSKKMKKDKKASKRKANPNDGNFLDFAKQAKLADIDDGLIEGDESEEEEGQSKKRSNGLLAEARRLKRERENKFKGGEDIDPKSFMNVKSKHLITAIPKSQEFDDIDDDDEVDKISKANKLSLAEAFEDDDIVNDFEKEFDENEESTKVSQSSKLLGWGSWSGFGVKPKNEKKKNENEKFIRKKKNRVIVSKRVNEKIQKHLIKQVPFPFKSIKDFEASMRMPIGREFIPASAYDKLTAQKIVTKAGTIIEPMTEEVLVEMGNQQKGNFAKGGKRQKKTVKSVK